MQLGVPEVFRHESRVAGRLAKPARRRVAQRVRRDLLLDPGALDSSSDDRREHLRLQPSASEAAEDALALQGNPWSKRKRYIWWDGAAGKWTGLDVPDFEETKVPDYVPPDGARAERAIAGDHPFIMRADGRSWLYVPQGLEDGPLPDEPGSELYPYVATTYRLTEHHTAGGMTRTVPYLAELQPAMFVEVDPELAEKEGLEHGGWATIYTTRAAIEARVLVTHRIPPVKVQDRLTHQIGLPYHWGTRGLTTGGSANDLTAIVLDPNVHIQEVKALSCGIKPGRRPRGPAVLQFMDEIRSRVQQ